MNIRVFAAATAALVCGAAASADAQSVGRMLESDFRNGAKDVLSIYAAPFDASARDWGLFAGALALTGMTMLVDEPVERWAQDYDSASAFKPLKPLRRGGYLFSGKYVVPPVAALYIIGLATKNQALRDGIIGCASTWFAQSPIRKGVYRLVGRRRPETAPDDAQEWDIPNSYSQDKEGWQMRSFPAGHFANAMGCATFLNKRFDMGVAGPAVYAIAAGVGLGRILDHAHWTSDTVLGGILGYAVGKEIAQRSLARDIARRANGATVTVAPDGGGLTMSLQWKF